MTPYIIQLSAAFIGSLSFAMFFNVRWGKLLSCAFGGCASWGLYLLLGAVISNDVTRYFLVSMALTFYAEIMARVKKTPDTIYIICAAIPLIPGGSLYNTMHCAAEGKWAEFSETGIHTLLLAAAIAVGILCMMTILHVYAVAAGNLKKIGDACMDRGRRSNRKHAVREKKKSCKDSPDFVPEMKNEEKTVDSEDAKTAAVHKWNDRGEDGLSGEKQQEKR